MKKMFKKLNKDNKYSVFEKSQTKNFILQDLWSFLSAWGGWKTNSIRTSRGMYWEWLRLDKTEDGKNVCLWSKWSIKDQAEIEGLGKEEQDAFDDAYWEYYEKRWNDISKLYMTIENYEELVEKWKEIVLTRRPQYIIFLQDDKGYVDLVGKDELSEQDLADMAREHEKYLKYKIAYDKYTKSRPEIVDELWHGPESSEYEADWQKFLED